MIRPKDNGIKVKYKLTGTGWAEAQFLMPRKKISIRISYLSDPLTFLLKAIIAISKSEKEFAEISFEDEPGEYKLQILRVSKKEIQLTFFHHKEGFYVTEVPKSKRKNSKKELKIIFPKIQEFKHIASYQCTIKEFITAVNEAVEELMSNVSIRDYKLKWTMPFPSKHYNEAKTLN